MRKTRKTGLGRRSRRFRWAVGIAAVSAVVSALAAWQASRPIAYERYVSTPLRDGSRLTFLYPASLDQNHSDDPVADGLRPPGLTVAGGYFGSPNPGRRFLERVPFLGRIPSLAPLFHVSDHESVEFQVMIPDMWIPRVSPMPAAASRARNSVRTDRDYGTTPWLDSERSDHYMEIMDWQSGLDCTLSHTVIGQRRRYERDDRVITSSFQLLPPGVAPPAP